MVRYYAYVYIGYVRVIEQGAPIQGPYFGSPFATGSVTLLRRTSRCSDPLLSATALPPPPNEIEVQGVWGLGFRVWGLQGLGFRV